MEGFSITRSSVRILRRLMQELGLNRQALLNGFTPAVFATDRALELVAQGVPFREAYQHVRNHLEELQKIDPSTAIRRKSHFGAPAGIVWSIPNAQVRRIKAWVRREQKTYERTVSRLLGVDRAAKRKKEAK
jgi:argininosuccinate lyase